MVRLYGINNCDTVKKAIAWLKQHHIDFEFIDFRTHTIQPARLRQWLDELGPSRLINKRSLTWRKLTDTEKDRLASGTDLSLLARHMTVIKRPVLETDNGCHVGFDAEAYRNWTR